MLANVAVDYFRPMSRHGNTPLMHILKHTYISLKLTCKYYIKITSCFDTNNAHLGLHFPKILENSKKIKGAMHNNITIFSQIVTPTGCIISAMDLNQHYHAIESRSF